MAAIKRGERYGYINTEGEEVIPCVFDMVENFEDGIAAVQKAGKWDYINKEGKEVIPYTYKKVYYSEWGITAKNENACYVITLK